MLPAVGEKPLIEDVGTIFSYGIGTTPIGKWEITADEHMTKPSRLSVALAAARNNADGQHHHPLITLDADVYEELYQAAREANSPA